MLQINNTGVCSQCLSYAGPAPASGTHHSGSTLLHRKPSEASPRLHAPPRSKPLRLSAQEALRGADLVGPAFCALPRSEQLRSLVIAITATYGLSLLPSVLGVPLAFLLRRMMTVQNPQKSQLAKKPACILVGNVSLGLQLTPSSPLGSGCPSPEGDGLQPAISVPSFVLCAGLAVSLGFSRGSYPTVWFASPSQFAQIALGAFRPDPYSKQCSQHLPAQPPLASGGCRHLRCFSTGGVTVGLVICEF